MNGFLSNYCLQVLQKHSQVDRQRGRVNNSQFFLPQILALIFRFLSGCGLVTARIKIIGDLLDLLDSNPSNIEALMVKNLYTIVIATFDVIPF